MTETFKTPWSYAAPLSEQDKRVSELLQRNPVTGLYPGQRDKLDLPDFLRRAPK